MRSAPRGALCALWLASTASATEHALGDGGWVVEGRGFYKAFGAGVLLPQGLVDSTKALQSLIEEARAELPPPAADALPGNVALPSEGALSTHLVRLSGRLCFGERLELAAAWQIGAQIGTSLALAQGAGLGSAAPPGSAAAAPRRLVDFDPVLARTGSLQVVHNLDQLSFKVKLPRGELVAGRQVLSWGTGRFWNPTDLLSPFGPTDLDKEVRRGVDAVRATYPVSEVTLVDLLFLPQPRAADFGGVVRAQTNLAGTDVSVSAAKYVSDLVLGADFSGDVGPLAVHGEAAYTLGLTGLGKGPVEVGEHFLRAVGGVDWKPGENVVLFAEYYFNGYGAHDPGQYLAKLSSPREARGEVFGAGRHYLGIGASWRASDLVSVSAASIANLADPSVMLVPSVEYWLAQSVIVRAGAYAPIGRQPDPSALRQLSAADLEGQTDAYRSAAASLGLRSEYGASPAGVFAQLGVYF